VLDTHIEIKKSTEHPNIETKNINELMRKSLLSLVISIFSVEFFYINDCL